MRKLGAFSIDKYTGYLVQSCFLLPADQATSKLKLKKTARSQVREWVNWCVESWSGAEYERAFPFPRFPFWIFGFLPTMCIYITPVVTKTCTELRNPVCTWVLPTSVTHQIQHLWTLLIPLKRPTGPRLPLFSFMNLYFCNCWCLLFLQWNHCGDHSEVSLD